MANVAKPYGFRPVQDRDGSPWTGKTQTCVIAAADAGNFFLGDMLKYTGDSVLGRDGIYHPVVTLANNTEGRLAGALVRLDPLSNSTNVFAMNRQGAQSDDIICYVPQGKEVLYEVQASNGALGANATEANINLATGTGDTSTNLSGQTIDSATVDVTATLQFRLVSLKPDPENEPGDFSQWIVQINQDAYSDTTGLAV